MTTSIPSRQSSQEESSRLPKNQRMVVIHPKQISKSLHNVLLKAFCLTDIGIFNAALYHRRQRLKGAEQTIFIHCVHGKGWCKMGNNLYSIKKNDLLVIPAHHSHAYGASDNDPWTIEWFHAIGNGTPDHLKRLGVKKEKPILELQHKCWDSSLFEEALSTLQNGFSDSHLIHASQTLGYLLSRIASVQKELLTSGATSSTARMAKAVTYLRENYNQHLSVENLATKAGLSTSHFTSLFLKYTEHTPIDFLIRVRIEKACQFLDTTAMSVKEIAEKVGYPDPYYFSRIFKKISGYSPNTYRNTSKG